MVFIIALYTPWCRYLESLAGISPQLYADNLKCTSYNVLILFWLLLSILFLMFVLLVKRLLLASVFYLAPLRLLVDA